MKRFITHPQMLKFEGGTETNDKIYIATEKVQSLGSYIDQLVKTNDLNTSGFTAMGLHQLSSALAFLNDDCCTVHGCIHPGSIFVNKAGSWKLSNFMLTHKYQEAGPEVKTNLNVLPERYHPKEFSGGFSTNLKGGTVYSIDSWCTGVLIYEIFNGRLDR
eukprot:UN24938